VNLSHLHLVLNHVPTVGAVGALGLLLLGFARRNDHLKHAALEVLFVIALLLLPVYVSGLAAHRELRSLPELSETAVRAHHDAALYGFAVMEFAAFVGWLALWQTRRRGEAARGLVPAVTVLLVLALAIMGRAANLGGDIRHPEIRANLAAAGAAARDAEDTAPSAVEDPAQSAAEGSAPGARGNGSGDEDRFLVPKISRYMAQDSRWAWPISEAIHFLGLSLSIGALLAVNLRILGVMRHVPFGEVHRWLLWGMIGFGANLITGMLFLVSQPGQYAQSAVFYWKVAFLMFTGANLLYLTVFKKGWALDGVEASLADKAMAVSSIAGWLAVLYTGRMLPFLGNAF
jgi:hypothetical protein